MKILVTGGAGFIGSNFIRYILSHRRNCSILNFDKLTYAGNLENLSSVSGDPRYSFVRGDICDYEAVNRSMKGYEVVVHFAAESHVDRSIFDPTQAIQTNITGTLVLLEAARRSGVRRFIHISTDEVYGDLPPKSVADETYSLRPNSPYSASKASGDLLLQSFVHTYGFPGIITRSSNNYGPYQFPEKFLPLMIANALDDKPLPVYGDGLQQRNWIHVDDNCRGILAVMERGKGGNIYNLGGIDVQGNLMMLRHLLKLLHKPETLIQFVADRPGHDRRYALDSSKAMRELGWKPKISLDAGLRKTVDWYRSNSGWVASVRSGGYRHYYETLYEKRDASLQATRMGSAPGLVG